MAFDRADLNMLHDMVNRAIVAESNMDPSCFQKPDPAMAAIAAVFNYLQGKELAEVGVAVVEMKTVDAFLAALERNNMYAKNDGDGRVTLDGSFTLTELKEALIAAYKV